MRFVTALTPEEGCLYEIIKWGIIIAAICVIGSVFIQLLPILILIGIIVLVIYMIHKYATKENTVRQQQSNKDYINQIAPENWTYRIQLNLSQDDSNNLGGNNVQHMFVDNNHTIIFPEGNNVRYYLININFMPTFGDNGEEPSNAVLTFVTIGTHDVVKIAPKMYKQDVVFLEEHFLLSNFEIKKLGL